MFSAAAHVEALALPFLVERPMATSSESKLLETQLTLLQQEIGLVNGAIEQGDEITKSIKQWTITVWAASLGGALTSTDLRPYSWATLVIPLLFWLVDTSHRVAQRRFIWRNLKIMEFLNDGGLERSVASSQFVGFTLLDFGSRRDRSPELRAFTSWQRVMIFKSLSVLYLGLSAISLLAWGFSRL